MDPDYANYDATQLEQALRSIDSARFPQRAEEIKRRLAALELRESAKPVPAAADRSLDLPILRRAGAILIATGLIDIAAMIYYVAIGQSYSSS